MQGLTNYVWVSVCSVPFLQGSSMENTKLHTKQNFLLGPLNFVGISKLEYLQQSMLFLNRYNIHSFSKGCVRGNSLSHFYLSLGVVVRHFPLCCNLYNIGPFAIHILGLVLKTCCKLWRVAMMMLTKVAVWRWNFVNDHLHQIFHKMLSFLNADYETGSEWSVAKIWLYVIGNAVLPSKLLIQAYNNYTLFSVVYELNLRKKLNEAWTLKLNIEHSVLCKNLLSR